MAYSENDRLIHQLAEEIHQYESDTFSGSDLKRRTTIKMARKMVQGLIGGLGTSIDGVQLTNILEQVNQ